jgi:MarR family transcriptional regulator, organic hydroperoxide resistance regulator
MLAISESCGSGGLRVEMGGSKHMRKNELDRITRHLKKDDSRFVTSRSPFYQTVRMLARYHARMNAVLKPSGIDMARWRVLRLLAERDVVTVSEMAEESVVHLSTMAKTVTRMVSEGLVTVRTSSRDARSTEVMIAPAGRKLLEQTREKVKYVFKDALRGLSKAEVQLLNSLSARIFENLSP